MYRRRVCIYHPPQPSPQFRDDPKAYRKRVRELAARSSEEG